MYNESIYIDGVNIKNIGICLQTPIEISAATPDFVATKIAGVNGAHIDYTGTYGDRKATAQCYALQKDVSKLLSKINLFLLIKQGYRRIELSDDPEHFWLGYISNGAQIAQKVRMLAPFTVEMSLKPQRFLKSGEIPIVMMWNGVVENPAFPSKPLIKVYGRGSGSVRVGNYNVNISDIDDITILDSEEQDAYNDHGNRNRYISATEFPVLQNGLNEIYFGGGVDHIEIVPRWWDL